MDGFKGVTFPSLIGGYRQIDHWNKIRAPAPRPLFNPLGKLAPSCEEPNITTHKRFQ